MVRTAGAQLSAFAVDLQRRLSGGAVAGRGGRGRDRHAAVGEEFLGCQCGAVWAVQGAGFDVSGGLLVG